MPYRLISLAALVLALSATIAHATDFSPSDVLGLQLWLDASQGVTTDGITPATDGSAVQQWNDQSGNGHTAIQNTGGSKPTFKTSIFNGQPVVRFNGGHTLITNSFLNSGYNTSMTTFLVTNKVNSTFQVSTSHQGLTWFTSRERNLGYNTSGLSDTQINDRTLGTIGANLGIETFRYNGSTKTLRFNGYVAVAESATGNLGLNGTLTIGNLSSGGFGYAGDIAELVIYNRALTDLEITNVEAYLADKYGISTTLRLPQVIFEGDSMTSNTTYPTRTMTLLGGPTSWYGLDSGVGSQTVAQMTAAAAAEIDPLYSSTAPENVVVLLGGTNDLYFGADATTTYNRIASYAQGRRAAGFRVIVSTILPRSNGGTPLSFEADRQTVNSYLRTNWATFADALADVASDSLMGDAGDETNTTYYSDLVHLTDAGNAIIAGYVLDAIRYTTTTLASGTNPSKFGANVILTATVTPSSATGTVTFKDGGTAIGTATLGHGSGSMTTSALSVGSHSLTVVYGGNRHFNVSTGATLTQVVAALAFSSSSSEENGERGGGRRGSPGRGGTAVARPTAPQGIGDSVHEISPAPKTLLLKVRERLAMRIEQRLRKHPELAEFLRRILNRLDARIAARQR